MVVSREGQERGRLVGGGLVGLVRWLPACPMMVIRCKVSIIVVSGSRARVKRCRCAGVALATDKRWVDFGGINAEPRNDSDNFRWASPDGIIDDRCIGIELDLFICSVFLWVAWNSKEKDVLGDQWSYLRYLITNLDLSTFSWSRVTLVSSCRGREYSFIELS